MTEQRTPDDKYVVFDYGNNYHLIDQQTGTTLCGIAEGWMPHATYYISKPLINLSPLPLCGTCQTTEEQSRQ